MIAPVASPRTSEISPPLTHTFVSQGFPSPRRLTRFALVSKDMIEKSVLITGCSAGGSGSALAQTFQKRGLHVFATARDLSKMSNLEGLKNMTLLSLDVTSASSIAAAVEAVTVKTGGRLAYLVNNSGASYVMPALDTDIEEGKKLFDVNLWGVVTMTKAFAPLVIASKGSIVNICSISGTLYAPYMGIYGASKAALENFSETLRLEMAPFGVKVVSVITGAVATNIMTNGPKPVLPTSSLYKPAEEEIMKRAAGEDVKSKQDVEEYAQKVVNDVLGGASGKIWRGQMASTTRIVSAVMSVSLVDKALVADTGLDKVGKK